MKNLETGARFANAEEYAVILLAAVKGCAVEQPIVGLHKAISGVVAVQESPGASGEGEEPRELSGGGQLEKRTALWIGDALIRNLRSAIEISVRGLKDDIGPRSLWTRAAIDAASTGESKYLIDRLCVGGRC